MGVSKNFETPFWGAPIVHDYNLLGSSVGPLIFGHSHMGS